MLLAAAEIPVAPEPVDLFVALPVADPDAGPTKAAFELTREARRAGLQAQLELTGRSLKGQLRHADRLKARYVAIVEAPDSASLKNMESGDQAQTPLDNVIPTILRGSRL
jgi:histidyl-tRNA synthetase